MPITFVRVFPTGNLRLQEVTRPEEIEAEARRFKAQGGRYTCEILDTGEACFTALLPDGKGDWRDVAHGKCANTIEVPGLVDQLIRESVTHLETVQ